MTLHILCLGTQDVRAPRFGGQRSVAGSLRAIATVVGVRLSYVIPSPTDFDENLHPGLRVCGLSAGSSNVVCVLWRALRYGLPYKFAKYHSARLIDRITGLASVEHFDAVFVHGAHLGRAGLQIKRRLNIPALLRGHNIEHRLIGEYSAYLGPVLRGLAAWQEWMTRRTEQYLWEHYDAAYFISDEDAQFAQKLCTRTGRDLKISVSCLYDGVSTGVSAGPKPERLPGERFVLSGNVNVVQNRIALKWFVGTVWPRLCLRYPDDVYLDITGTDERGLLSATGLDQGALCRYRIAVLGEVPNFQSAISARRYFVSPTVIGSGYRVKIVEAGIAGACVFMSARDERSMRFYRHGYNCLVFSDPDSFCEAYETVRNREAVQESLRTNMRRDLGKYMDWSLHARTVTAAVRAMC